MIDEQVKAAAVGVLVIIAVFNVSGYYLANRNVEPFSELGVLGPAQQIGGYPSTAVVGQSFPLYAYVGNHEGAVEYYQVLVKAGDQSTAVSNSTAANAPLILSRSLVLSDNSSTVFPVTLSMPTAGLNQRLIFELWMFNSTTSQFGYTGLWNQLWINVTSH
jgi:uncharacterized membrane protein